MGQAMDFRQKLLLIPIAALFRWLSGPDQVGQTYASRDSLKRAQQQAGYGPI
jgi:hypothetical protein